MSYSPTSPTPNRFLERIEAGIARVESASDDEDSGTSLTGTAKELFDVLESSDVLLQTIDLDKLPDAVVVEELPNLVDLERLSDAIKTHNPDLSFDMSHLERVVNKRALWNSIDLPEFVKAKRTLDRDLEDVLGEVYHEKDALVGIGSDSKAVSDVKRFVSMLRSESGVVLIQQEATAKADAARGIIIDRHAAVERRNASIKRRAGSANEQRPSRNPTAVSLLSSWPSSNGVSTRVSTVPSDVRYAKMDTLPRIYGRRWNSAPSKRRR